MEAFCLQISHVHYNRHLKTVLPSKLNIFKNIELYFMLNYEVIIRLWRSQIKVPELFLKRGHLILMQIWI